MAAQPQQQLPRSFYRRKLPQPPAIPFSSAEGKSTFQRSLSQGFLHAFFPLVEQFRTQDEPSFCGLSTLTMVLNALGRDPGRVWKGPWRWFHEEMLGCCVPIPVVRKEGITFRQLKCLARCNGANVDAVVAHENAFTLDEFREQVKKATSSDSKFMIVSYSRKEFQQSGDGHFSPIGGYDELEDMVLILDVARFKYPPHWVSLSLLYRAMQRIDPATSSPRGYMLLSSTGSPSLYFVISPKSPQSWRKLLKSLENKLFPLVCGDVLVPEVLDDNTQLENAICCVVERCSSDIIDIFSTYIEEFGLNYVPSEHQAQVDKLLDQLHETPAFKAVKRYAQSTLLHQRPLGIEIVTMLLLALPERAWSPLPECTSKGRANCLRHCFDDSSLPYPLSHEVTAVRFQIEALLSFCNPEVCSGDAVGQSCRNCNDFPSKP